MACTLTTVNLFLAEFTHCPILLTAVWESTSRCAAIASGGNFRCEHSGQAIRPEYHEKTAAFRYITVARFVLFRYSRQLQAAERDPKTPLG